MGDVYLIDFFSAQKITENKDLINEIPFKLHIIST